MDVRRKRVHTGFVEGGRRHIPVLTEYREDLLGGGRVKREVERHEEQMRTELLCDEASLSQPPQMSTRSATTKNEKAHHGCERIKISYGTNVRHTRKLPERHPYFLASYEAVVRTPDPTAKAFPATVHEEISSERTWRPARSKQTARVRLGLAARVEGVAAAIETGQYGLSRKKKDALDDNDGLAQVTLPLVRRELLVDKSLLGTKVVPALLDEGIEVVRELVDLDRKLFVSSLLVLPVAKVSAGALGARRRTHQEVL